VTISRESHATQTDNGNLAEQVERVRRAVQDRGGVVVFEHQYTGSGIVPDLGFAVMAAEDANATALVAETVDRFLRPGDYDQVTNPNAEPDEQQYRILRHLTHGLKLLTVQPPHSTPAQNHGAKVIRGQEAKGNRGGGGQHKIPRAERKAQALERIKELQPYCRVRGIALRIAREFEVTPKTVYQWLRELNLLPGT
jgi:hypothetical protein